MVSVGLKSEHPVTHVQNSCKDCGVVLPLDELVTWSSGKLSASKQQNQNLGASVAQAQSGRTAPASVSSLYLCRRCARRRIVFFITAGLIAAASISLIYLGRNHQAYHSSQRIAAKSPAAVAAPRKPALPVIQPLPVAHPASATQPAPVVQRPVATPIRRVGVETRSSAAGRNLRRSDRRLIAPPAAAPAPAVQPAPWNHRPGPQHPANVTVERSDVPF